MDTAAIAQTQPRPPPWMRLLGRVPMPVMQALAHVLAFVLRDLLRVRRDVARENLARSLPELDAAARRRIERAHYLSVARVLLELPRMAVMEPAELRRRVAVPALPQLRAELAGGDALLVLSSHQCNWEWLLQALAAQLRVPFIAAYKPPHSAAADRLMIAMRSRFGVQMVPGKRLLREVLRRRGQAHIVAMVADQMPTTSAGRVWLRFLGRDTAFFPGPGEIARIGAYRAYFLALRRLRPGYYEVCFEPLCVPGENLDVAEFTARYAAHVEAHVRAHAPDWAWTHRRWKQVAPPRPDAVAPT